jgi:hypothetical protein
MPTPRAHQIVSGSPATDPLLDPQQLPTGLRLDAAERTAFFQQYPTTRRHLQHGPPPETPPPPPPQATLLYPFLFAVLPGWTYGLQGRGDCMAWSSCLAIDVLAAVQVAMIHRPEQWHALTSIECQYGLMRVEVYGGRPDYGGDGASPTAAATAITKLGSLHRIKYLEDTYDFTTYDRSGGRSGQYGRFGIPDALEPIAKEHKAHQAVLIEDFDHAVEVLKSGYAISNAAPDNPIPRARDSEGFGKQVWRASHAMNYLGYRLGKRPGLLQVNSGHGNHVTGPHWPADIPPTLAACSAWIDKSDVEHVLRQQWSFAYSDYEGFPERDLSLATEPFHNFRPRVS